MQWNCPHCGITLAVAENALGSGWSFSRCYKCGGFALIRKAEINIIKVDKAPPGEKILLPEGPNDSNINLMNIETYQKPHQGSAQASPAQIYNGGYEMQNKPTSAQNPEIPISPPPPFGQVAQRLPTLDLTNSKLPEPLPKIPEGIKRPYLIPIGMSATTLLMLVSGGYLYIQGQTLWTKARESTDRIATLNKSPETLAQAPAEAKAPAPASEAAVLLATDNQLRRLEITDKIQKSAMAPFKETYNKELHERPEVSSLPFSVRIRSQKANLHSGPGMKFPVIGTAIPEEKYAVADWNNRWFKLQIKKSNLAFSHLAVEEAWVRNDLVEVVR